jgi:uncharacterized membrane protein YgdD (TMEM256/DUF423 family)
MKRNISNAQSVHEANRIYKLTAGIFLVCGIVSGAFGAHALESVLAPESLAAWRTGGHYLMAMGCAILGASAHKNSDGLGWVSLGTAMFSFSIFGLILVKVWGGSAAILGPVTPIGGALMIGGWLRWMWSMWRDK